MELNNKQIKYLKALAHGQKAIFQIGKGGLSDNMLEGLDAALTAHELIKIHILQSYSESIDALIIDISRELNCAFVQKIGKMIIFYRPSKQKKITLPR
ncbi:MAG: ribosome assembly RNA-binding protein YhbY [Culicoidibacterales bacterium]